MVHSWSYMLLLYINDLPDDVICNTAVHTDAQVSDLWL